MIEILTDQEWQLTPGEQAAVAGVLSQLKPSLALQVGAADGAGLRAIAAACDEVHSFALIAPSLPVPDNAVVHTGNPHELVASALEEFALAGRNVDFVMVDGADSAQGIRADLENLLNAPALARTVILIHDTANETVRRGLDTTRFAAWPKVATVELDWVPGHLCRKPTLCNELWFGLGLVRLDASRLAYRDGPVQQHRFHPSALLLADARDVLLERGRSDRQLPYGELVRRLNEAHDHIDRGYREARAPVEEELARTRTTLEVELAETRAQLDQARNVAEGVYGSLSWRLTAPLRQLKAVAVRRLR